MKILCPIMASADIDVLDPEQYGAEFFCGYLPEWWIKNTTIPMRIDCLRTCPHPSITETAREPIFRGLMNFGLR